MFDISWTEFLLIGVVALVVIGPKELPAVMRTLGQWTRKLRSMASDFQNQFQEALREAEMADLKKQVDNLAQDVKNFDPLKGVREDIVSAGEEVKQSLSAPEPAPVSPADGTEPPPAQLGAPLETPAAGVESAPAQTAEPAAPAPAAASNEQLAGVAAETTAAIEGAAATDGTGRSV